MASPNLNDSLNNTTKAVNAYRQAPDNKTLKAANAALAQTEKELNHYEGEQKAQLEQQFAEVEYHLSEAESVVDYACARMGNMIGDVAPEQVDNVMAEVLAKALPSVPTQQRGKTASQPNIKNMSTNEKIQLLGVALRLQEAPSPPKQKPTAKTSDDMTGLFEQLYDLADTTSYNVQQATTPEALQQAGETGKKQLAQIKQRADAMPTPKPNSKNEKEKKQTDSFINKLSKKLDEVITKAAKWAAKTTVKATGMLIKKGLELSFAAFKGAVKGVVNELKPSPKKSLHEDKTKTVKPDADPLHQQCHSQQHKPTKQIEEHQSLKPKK